jgi:hypothetical protein
VNDRQLELVAAYLDGETTADERALVEADTALIAEVERQRTIRALVHEVEPPSDAARESAIANALAVFDAERVATVATGTERPDVTAPTNVVPFEQRRRLRLIQGLGAAAAVAVIAVAGAVVSTRGNDSDDQADQKPVSATVAERDVDTAPPDNATAATVAPEILAVTADTGLSDSAEEPDAAAAESQSNEAGDAAGASESDDASDDSEAALEAPAMPAPAGAAPTTATTTAAGVVIATERDLLALTDEIKPDVPALDDVAGDCADQRLKADALFDPGNGDRIPIVVVVVAPDRVGALGLDDCAIVLEADR